MFEALKNRIFGTPPLTRDEDADFYKELGATVTLVREGKDAAASRNVGQVEWGGSVAVVPAEKVQTFKTAVWQELNLKTKREVADEQEKARRQFETL